MPRRLACFAVCVLASIAFAACGMVTGLSDNYKYDLVDGSTTTADGATADGSSDAAADAPFDAGGLCSQNQAKNFQDYVNGLNGNSDCKACIESSQCCPAVNACQNSGCKSRFECELNCTEQQVSQRQQCMSQCQQSASAAWTFTARCVTNDCASKCGQWQ